MTATKTEKPILFSTEMIQAILDGRKTQTRRVIKPQPKDTRAKGKPVRKVRDYFTGVPEQGKAYYWRENGCWNSSEPFKCPYIADELWVRETHAYVPKTAFQASVGVQQVINPEDGYEAAIFRASFDRSEGGIKWRPSIHMPRWASRIQLTITDVRVERVQEITEDDAKAEGVELYNNYDGTKGGHAAPTTYCGGFRLLWDSINADRGYSWESNPWVWVVDFEVKNIQG